MRWMFSAADRGEIDKSIPHRWAKHTPNTKSLPETAKKPKKKRKRKRRKHAEDNLGQVLEAYFSQNVVLNGQNVSKTAHEALQSPKNSLLDVLAPNAGAQQAQYLLSKIANLGPLGGQSTPFGGEVDLTPLGKPQFLSVPSDQKARAANLTEVQYPQGVTAPEPTAAPDAQAQLQAMDTSPTPAPQHFQMLGQAPGSTNLAGAGQLAADGRSPLGSGPGVSAGLGTEGDEGGLSMSGSRMGRMSMASDLLGEWEKLAGGKARGAGLALGKLLGIKSPPPKPLPVPPQLNPQISIPKKLKGYIGYRQRPGAPFEMLGQRDSSNKGLQSIVERMNRTKNQLAQAPAKPLAGRVEKPKMPGKLHSDPASRAIGRELGTGVLPPGVSPKPPSTLGSAKPAPGAKPPRTKPPAPAPSSRGKTPESRSLSDVLSEWGSGLPLKQKLLRAAGIAGGATAAAGGGAALMGGEGDKVAPGGLTELITGGEADQQLAPDTQKPTEGAAPKPTESAQMPTAPAAAQPKAPQVPEIPTVRPPGPTAPPATASEGIDWGALGNTAKSVAPAAGLAGLGYLASQLLASPLGMGHSEDLTEQEAESRALKRKLMALGLGGAGAGLGYYYGPQITGALTPKAASDQLNCQQFFSSTIPCPLDGRQVSGMVRKASEEALHPSSEADNDGPRAKCQRAGVRSRGWVV